MLALDLSRVTDIEYSALQALMASDEQAKARSAEVWLVGLNPGVLDIVRRGGLDQRLGRERLLIDARVALERYQALQ